jgi:NAD(P)-dependent dehydrogenase (short-subunit alcohol dehydrogenase family)
MSLQGKVAVITGSSRGIGRAIALRLARDGAYVVINFSTNAAPADELVKEIGNDRAIAIKADVAQVEEVKRLVKETVDKWKKIDILINCAGVLPMADLKGTSEEEFDRTFSVNVKGPYFLTQVISHQIFLISGSSKVHECRIDCSVLFFHNSRCNDRNTSLLALQCYKRGYRANDKGSRKRSRKTGDSS